MKTYDELTEAERKKAVEFFLDSLLYEICEGAIRFNDKPNGDNLQSRIDRACQEAESMQTPWFVGECVMERCGEELRGMALRSAKDSLYSARS